MTDSVQNFERYPDLAEWIERLANLGVPGWSIMDWQEFTNALNAALTANNHEAWVAALLNAPNPEQALAAEPKGTWSDGGKVWTPATYELDDERVLTSEITRLRKENSELASRLLAATPAPAKSRIERAKAIREEQQCSLQEAVRLERAEFLTAEIQSASSIEDLKTILLSIVNYRHKA